MRAAKVAGVTAVREPPTASLLGNTYTTEQCKALFPNRRLSEAAQADATATKQLLDLLDANPDPVQRALIIAALDRLAAAPPLEGAGLRVDLQLFDPHALGAKIELWVDYSCIHPTAASYRDKLLNMLRLEQANDPATPAQLPMNSCVPDSTALAEAAKTKIGKYTPLLNRGRMLRSTGKIPHQPKFVPCIVTHCGEFGAGLLEVVEWLCMCYRRNTAPVWARMTGVSISKATACFRLDLLDGWACSIAAGWAQQLLAVGFPLGSQ